MMSRFIVPALAFSLGCSGGTFEVNSPDPDSGATDSGDDSGADSAAPDTSVPDACASPNSCGGCGKLDHTIGEACGVCKSGQWKCSGPNAMVCDDPFSGPVPDTACGTCKTLKLTCGPDGTSAVCPTDDANACGGCGTIVNFPGSKCGTCKTLEYQCAVDKSGTFCPGDDHNGCMGCTPLANAPGKVCGVCSGGSYQCDGVNATKCVDPVTTPAPGTTCGVCSKSSYVCMGLTTTACAKPDDRSDGGDSFYTTYAEQVWTLEGSFATNSSIGISFTTARLGAVTSVTISLQRVVYNGTYPDFGDVRIQLIKGAPTATPASSDILATTSVGGETVPDVPGTMTVPIPGAPSLPAGTRLWVRITDGSERFNYVLHGGPPTGPAHLSAWPLVSSPFEYLDRDPYLRVGMLGCF